MRKSLLAKDKIRRLEAQLEALKRLVIRLPDAKVDEENWARVRETIKRSRKATFRKQYGKT